MKKKEMAYKEGKRAVWLGILKTACRELGYDDAEVSWITEREAAIYALREVCSEYGDNEWQDDLYLADIIEKHLYRNLSERDKK